jgi:hypothetical protein
MQALSTTWSILSKRRSTAFSFWVIGLGLPAALLAYVSFIDVDGPPLIDPLTLLMILVLLTAAYTWRNVGSLGWGFGIVGLQIAVQSPIIILFGLMGIMEAIMPNARVNDPKLEVKFEERLSTRFGIEIGEDATVEYFTLWTIGAEHGYNLILRVEDFDPDKYAPTGSEFQGGYDRDFRDYYADWPFCGGGKECVAGFGISHEIDIEDPEIRATICGPTTEPVMSAFHQAKSQWRITTVYFPESNLVWINDTSW